jgi:hypothetical protein
MLLPPLFRKSSGQTIKEICNKEAVANYLAISSQKGQDSCPRTGFRARKMCQSIPPPHSGRPNGGKWWQNNGLLFSVRELHKIELASLSVSQKSLKGQSNKIF